MQLLMVTLINKTFVLIIKMFKSVPLNSNMYNINIVYNILVY